eukprot:jgi/Tetstr1/466920/TSEL_011374.t1
MWVVELRAAQTRVVDESGDGVLEDLAGPLASALKLPPSKRSPVARADCSDVGAEPVSAMRSASDLQAIPHYSDFPLHSMRKRRPAIHVGFFGYGGIRGNTVAVDTTIAPILGVTCSDPTTALRAAERHKIQKYDEGVRNAAGGILRFVPFAISEFGSLAPHAEAFLVELAKASHTHTSQKTSRLLSAWRRRFSLLINMAHADNVLGGVAARRARHVTVLLRMRGVARRHVLL